jgi:hypothetical protein
LRFQELDAVWVAEKEKERGAPIKRFNFYMAQKNPMS